MLSLRLVGGTHVCLSVSRICTRSVRIERIYSVLNFCDQLFMRQTVFYDNAVMSLGMHPFSMMHLQVSIFGVYVRKK